MAAEGQLQLLNGDRLIVQWRKRGGGSSLLRMYGYFSKAYVMVRVIVIKIIRVTFWTSQHIFPYSICSHRGLNIGGHHCVQNVQNVQLEKNVKFTKPGKFPRHHWSHWCLQWSTLVKLRRVNKGARRYKTVLGGEIQHCTVANELKLFFRRRISTLLPMNWQFAHRIAHLPLRGQPGWLDLEQDQFRNYHDCHHLHHDLTIMIVITWKATCM